MPRFIVPILALALILTAIVAGLLSIPHEARVDLPDRTSSIRAGITTVLHWLFGVQVAHADISTGLIGHWTFDNTTNDSSGQGNNGTASGGPTFTTGKVGQALSFDGIDDEVDMGNASALNMGIGSFAISAWVKTTSGTYQVIAGKKSGLGEVEAGYLFHTDNTGKLFMRLSDGNSIQVYSISNNGIADGAWHHVVAVVDRSTNIADSYIDGVKENRNASTAATTGTVSNGYTFKVGNRINLWLFNGTIDDVRVYNRALAQADITELFNAPTDTTAPTRSNASLSGTLSAGTTQTTISLTTSDATLPVTCRYSQTSGTSYDSIPNTFSTTGDTTHSQTITGLTNGNSYTYYVRCIDGASNANTTDFTIQFSVASSDGTGDITAGLRAHYTFDEGSGSTANDTSGNGNNGTLSGSGTTWTGSGRIGGALQFGANGYVSVGGADINAPWTASMWVQPTGRHNAAAFLLNGGSYSVRLEEDSVTDNVGFTYYGVADNTFSYAAPLNTWTHLVFAGNTTQTKLYVNGVLQQTMSKVGGAPFSTIGGAAGIDRSVRAILDDVRVYNRELSQADITALFNWTGSGTPVPTVSISASPSSITSGQSSTITWSSTNATSCTASGGWSGSKSTSGNQSVSPSVTTTYTLSCTGAGGSGQNSTQITVTSSSDTTQPSTPTLNAPTAVSSSQINLSWSTASDAESGISGYRLYWCSGSSSCTPSTVITLGNVTSYSHTGRSPSTIHRYQIAAVNGAGLEGGKSSPIQEATTLASTIHGTAYYVAKTGNNSHTCTQAKNPATPKATIHGGMACMSGGDTLIIGGGTYDEYISYYDTAVPPSGTSWNTATVLKAAPGETVVIRPTSLGFIEAVVALDQGQYVIFENLILDGASLSMDHKAGMFFKGTANHMRVIGGEIKNFTGAGISTTDPGNTFLEFVNIKVHDIGPSAFVGGDHGIYVRNQDNLIDGNEIYNTTGWGVHLYSKDTSRSVIRNNRIYNTGRSGILMTSGTDIKAYNNVLFNNDWYGIELNYGNAYNPLIFNNTIYNSGFSCFKIISDGGVNAITQNAQVRNNICSSSAVMTGDGGTNTTYSNNLCTNSGMGCTITGSPQFVNAAGGDFHLQSGSPAKDTGTSLVSSVVATDIDGISRPQGSAYDIGAYEFVSGGGGSTPLVGDLNADGTVNSLDWGIMNSQWFTSNSQSDINGDSLVNSLDFGLLNQNWGLSSS